ncbi:MAG: glutamate--cysteine ligase [Hasllibacter sp.]
MSVPQSGGTPIESRDDLAAWMEQGCKPKADWRIGTEHEKLGYTEKGHRPIPYDGPASVKAVLSGLRDQFGWTSIEEDGNLIGLSRGKAGISLEPGGALELAGAPLETIHETCDEVNQHLREVQQVASGLGVEYIGLGFAPEWRHEDMPLMPKGRYRLMDSYMDTVGTTGKEMMRRSCTVQVNLDFASEADMVRKLRVALNLQPVATALFANSPFKEGEPTGLKSYRAKIWRYLDPARTGMPAFVFEDGFGFEAWVDWALDVPMYFVHRNGVYHDALGKSFRDFMDGRLDVLPGERPTTADWAYHLTTLFPEARVKRFMEMRGADGGPWRRLCALPALWVGLLYDEGALGAAEELTKDFTQTTREGLRSAASEDGLQGEADGVKLHDLCRRAVEIAEAGLAARAKPGAGGLIPDETHFLNALKETVETGMAPADVLLEKYRGEWAGDLSRIYPEFRY